MFFNAAVIGLGVGEQHLYGYEEDDRVRMLYAYDFNPEIMEKVAKRHPSVKFLNSINDIIENNEIDIISIATYDDSHYDLMIRAIDKGKHIFVEKPMCLNFDEYLKLSEALKKNTKIKISSNLILRRVPRFIELKNKIQKKEFGQIYFIKSSYDYGRLEKLIYGWRAEINGYSVVHGGAIHLIDLILWLTDDKVIEVFAYGNNIATSDSKFSGNSLVSALLKFDSGMVVNVTGNYATVSPHHHLLSIYGKDQTFEQSHLGSQYIRSRNPNKDFKVLQDKYPNVKKYGLINSFIDSIEKNIDSIVSRKDVFDVMAISLAIEKSVNSGRNEIVHYATF